MAAAALSQAAEIKVSPGQLEDIIASGAADGASIISLSGSIDARDFAALGNLPQSVKTLDLSQVKLNALSTSANRYFGRSFFGEGEIPCYAFFQSKLENIILPESTFKIGDGAFADSAVKSISLPEGVTTVGDYAFYNCDALTSLSLPTTLRTIGKGALANCDALTTLSLAPTAVTELADYVFANSSQLRVVELPAGITTVGREAFVNTAIVSLNLENVTEFADYALSGMRNLQSLSLNPDANATEGMLMDNERLTELFGAASELPDYYLANCSRFLPTTVLEDVTSIGRYALANIGATEIVLGPSLTNIDKGALYGMDALTLIDARQLDNAVPDVTDDAFFGIDKSLVWVYVTENSADLWRSHPVWKEFNIRTDSQEWLEVDATLAENVDIRIVGDLLCIDAPGPVDAVAIYALDGKLLFEGSSPDRHMEIEAARFDSATAIVTARSGESRKTVKLILK